MNLILSELSKNVVSDFPLDTSDGVLKRKETFESFTG
jgi:hypothetical protein